MLREHSYRKLVPLIALLCILSVAITVFVLRDRTYRGRLPNLVKQHRDVVAVIVQVLSAGLAILQELVLCSLINFAARIRLFHGTVSLRSLSFWSALSIPRLDTTLPWTKLTVLGLTLALGPTLAAVWSGSLTPISTVTYLSGGNITLPTYTSEIDATYTIVAGGSIGIGCNHNVPNNLSVLDMSSCPALDLASALMASARSATSLHGSHLHTKLDNNDWTYVGRSFGVGSSQGLFDLTDIGKTEYEGYSYLESGYKAGATCKQTQIELLNFQTYMVEMPTPLNITYSYADTMTLASGNISIQTYDVLLPAGMGFFVWVTSPSTKNLLVTYAAGEWYTPFRNMSCSIEFEPTLFNVSVSIVNSTMKVVPVAGNTTFDTDGSLANVVMQDLDLLSRTSSNMAVSALGEVLKYNRMAINETQPDIWPDYVRLSETVMKVVLESFLDDLLVARATEQMIIYANRTQTSVQGFSPAVVIGTSIFHHTQLVFSILLTFAYIAEALRTRFWTNLPRFNFVETANLAAAALGPSPQRRTTSIRASHAVVSGDAESSPIRVSATYNNMDNPRLLYEHSRTSDSEDEAFETAPIAKLPQVALRRI